MRNAAGTFRVHHTPVLAMLSALAALLSIAFVAEARASDPTAEIVLSGGVVRDGARVEIIDQKSGEVREVRCEGRPAVIVVPATPHFVCTRDPVGRATGLFRITPKPGAEIRVEDLPAAPRGKSQVYVTLAFPKGTDPDALPKTLRTSLTVDERHVPPDFTLVNGDRIRLFWLGTSFGEASLAVASDTWMPEKPVLLTLVDRGTHRLPDVTLARRPALRLRLAGADRLPPGPFQVELFSCEKVKEFMGDAPRLAECEAPITKSGSAESEFSFTGLSPGAYAYRWRRGTLSAAGWIPVPGFADVERTIDVDAFEISGRVERRGEPVSARLVFEPKHTGGAVETNADEEGRYQVRVAQKGWYTVNIHAGDHPDFPATLEVKGDTTKDFTLPANRYRALVVSAEDGAPVPEVRVSYEVREESKQRDTWFRGSGFTSADGTLELAPIPVGNLDVSARKLGYRPATVPPIHVDEKSAGQEILISLANAPTITIRLLEPDGTPAAGGFVWAEPGGLRGAPFTEADGTTTIDTELAPGTPLFAFDKRGRMAFARYGGEKQQDIAIPPSGPAITVRFQAANGEPISGAFVRVGVDGLVMQYGPIAQQAFWSGTEWRTNADGVARIVGLPAGGLLTVFPMARPDYVVTRRLPVTEEIVFTLPVDEPKKPKPQKPKPESRTAALAAPGGR